MTEIERYFYILLQEYELLSYLFGVLFFPLFLPCLTDILSFGKQLLVHHSSPLDVFLFDPNQICTQHGVYTKKKTKVEIYSLSGSLHKCGSK